MSTAKRKTATRKTGRPRLPESERKKQLTLHLPRAVCKWIEDQAKREDRSVSYVASRIFVAEQAREARRKKKR